MTQPNFDEVARELFKSWYNNTSVDTNLYPCESDNLVDMIASALRKAVEDERTRWEAELEAKKR